MSGRAELNQRLEAWLRRRNYSPRRLSLEAGLGEGMVRRILESDAYAPRSDTWRKLARYLGWDEGEILALAGFGERPTPPADPVAAIAQILAAAGYPEGDREFLTEMARRLAPAPSPVSNSASS